MVSTGMKVIAIPKDNDEKKGYQKKKRVQMEKSGVSEEIHKVKKYYIFFEKPW